MVQVLPDNRMLIIGDNVTEWLLAFPFASEGYSDDATAYDADYLQNFSVIGVTRARPLDLDPVLGDWVRQGNTLIVDLSGMAQIYQQGYSVFDVRTVSYGLNGSYPLNYAFDPQGLPQQMTFATDDGSAWFGATYLGADEDLITVVDGGQTYSLLSRRDVGAGTVYFVGFNLIPLLQETDAAAPLTEYLLRDTEVDRALGLPPVAIDVTAQQPTSLSFDYTLAQDSDVVISMTYFPRWQARVDDRPLLLSNHENLMRLQLPAGSHTVSMSYEPYSSGVAQAGLLTSGIFLVLTAGCTLMLRQQPSVSYADRRLLFDDHVPLDDKIAGENSRQYASCPSCGFRLADVGNPDARTYPFYSLECPICGFSLSEDSLRIQQSDLTDFDRRRLFRRWLQGEYISRVSFMQRFGFPLEEAFESRLDDFVYDDDSMVDAVAELEVLRGRQHWVRTVAFRDNQVLSAGKDRIIRLWNQDNAADFTMFIGHQDTVQCVAFHPADDTFASGSDDLSVRLWNIDSTSEVVPAVHHLAEVLCLTFSRSGKLLFSGGQDNVIRVWDGRRLQQLGMLRGHQTAVTSVAHANRLLVSASADGTVRLWDVERERQIRLLLQFENPVVALYFDGETVAAIDDHRTLAIASLQSDVIRYPQNLPPQRIRSAAFSSSGHQCACVGDSITLYETLSASYSAPSTPTARSNASCCTTAIVRI